MSTSISSGWARSRSSGSAPTKPVTRRPRSSMASVTGADQARRGSDDLARRRSHLPLQHVLDDGDGTRLLGYEPGEDEVAGDSAFQPIAELVVVHDHLVAGG